MLLSALTITALSSLALNAGDLDIFNVSLKELAEMEITTVSRQKDTITTSPATVSIVTQAQLRDWGALDIYEALSFLPGVVKNETFMGFSVLTFRGVTPGLYNNKALFMINGHPVHEKLFGSSRLENIPLEMIDHIEVIRGPGSALYGTQATSAVVNIITRNDHQKGSEANIRLGSFDHAYASLIHQRQNLAIAASSQRDNGYDFAGEDEFATSFRYRMYNDIDNIFVDWQPAGWRINASAYQQMENKYGVNPFDFQHGDSTWKGLYLDINRHWQHQHHLFNVWLRLDYFDQTFSGGEFPAAAGSAFYSSPEANSIESSTGYSFNAADPQSTAFNTTYRESLEFQHQYRFANGNTLISGASYEYDKSSDLSFKYDIDEQTNPLSPYPDIQPSTYNAGLYVQYRHAFTSRLNGILGGRVEDNQDTGFTGLIPRLGMVYGISDHQAIKALYGEAFRTPVFLEKYAQVPGILIGDADLKREKTRTLELTYDGQSDEKTQLQVTLFRVELSDEITRRTVGSETQYFNGDGRLVYGLESSWQHQWSDALQSQLNFTWQAGEDRSLDEISSRDVDRLYFTPDFYANAMLGWQMRPHWRSSVSAQYIGQRRYLLTDDSSASLDDYSLLNASLAYQHAPHQIRLTLRNLLDTDYVYPEPVRRNLESIPGGPGFSSYLSYRLQF